MSLVRSGVSVLTCQLAMNELFLAMNLAWPVQVERGFPACTQYAKIEENENYRKKTFETNNLETVFCGIGH